MLEKAYQTVKTVRLDGQDNQDSRPEWHDKSDRSCKEKDCPECHPRTPGPHCPILDSQDSQMRFSRQSERQVLTSSSLFSLTVLEGPSALSSVTQESMSLQVRQVHTAQYETVKTVRLDGETVRQDGQDSEIRQSRQSPRTA